MSSSLRPVFVKAGTVTSCQSINISQAIGGFVDMAVVGDSRSDLSSVCRYLLELDKGIQGA